MKSAHFAMAFHCYQPVYNFGWEFENAYRKAYKPLIKTLEEFPGIKASFHFSGNILEWLADNHPGFIDRVRALVDAGRIELIGGGYFEPVLAMISEEDRLRQLNMGREIIEKLFFHRNRGIWLAEKVWEPELADTLSSVGIEYTIVDDYHMFQAGLDEDKIFGPCLTRGDKGSVVLFPSLTRLRYSMPFRKPEVTLEYMKRVFTEGRGSERCFFFADDAEKFGAWPYTYMWVHKKGWLRDFLRSLEKNADWLKTSTFSEVLDTVKPFEAGSVPACSYAEMMEWSGGNFRNFLARYPEAGRMYERMTSVSRTFRDARGMSEPGVRELKNAGTEILKSQSNCAYWHGTFGGVYFPHLREGVYRHLINAEKEIRKVRGDTDSPSIHEYVKTCGRKETVISNGFFDVYIDPLDGGVVSELDYRRPGVNLVNTMARTREKYHDKLFVNRYQRIRRARKAIAGGSFADVHDALGVAERGLKKVLAYDDRSRAFFVNHVSWEHFSWKSMTKERSSNEGFLKGLYALSTAHKGDSVTCELTRRDEIFDDMGRGPLDIEVRKDVTVGIQDSLYLRNKVTLFSGRSAGMACLTEFNLMLWDKSIMKGPRTFRAERFWVEDMYSGLRVEFKLDREYRIVKYPVYTVNETESGLKKTFQGVSVLVCGEYSSWNAGDAYDMSFIMTIRA